MRTLVLGFSTVMLAVVLILSSSPAKAYAQQQKNIWDGVYSDEQVTRGAVAYVTSCSGCHRLDLSGVQGALKDAFMNHWQQDTLQSIYSYMQKNMPANKPGSLKPEMYADILAYILGENGFPAGASDLKPEGLNLIRILPKDGNVTALPAGALAVAYGCMVEGPDKTWQLTRATALVRTRTPDKSSDEELKLAESNPAGMQTYELLDTTFLHPERHVSHKVEVKGFVVQEPSNSLNVVSLGTVSSTCQ